MNRHDLDMAIEDHDEHISTMRYLSHQANSTEQAIPHYGNLSSDDMEKLDEAISLMREVADRHDEKAKELNEEYGPL